MRKSLQYIESIEKYYQRLWGVPEAAVRDLARFYEYNKDIWEFKDFQWWFNGSYGFKMSYKQWVRFIIYLKRYERRKQMKCSIVY